MRKRFLDQRLVLKQAATGASSLRGNFREPLFVLLGAAGLVLLIACANLGNLLLARTTARSREMSVRLALGASRGRLIRQLMTESLCLATFGGLVGLFTAFVLRQGLLRLVSDTPILLPGGLDLRTVSFVVALTVAAGLILGLLPGLRITKTQAVTGLREQGRGVVGSTAWLRLGKLIVVGQLALSLPLLVGAGLLVRTLFNLQRVDLGYPKDNLLTARVDGQAAGYDPVRQAAAFEELLSRIRTVPGVRLATYSDNGIFGGSDNGDQIVVEGYAPKGPDDNGSRYDQIGPGYFSTLGVPVLLGREIAEQDLAAGRAVCVINETFAKKFFEGRNPIGLHVTQTYAEERHTYEVVGVVRDSRQNRLRGNVEHRFYVPASAPAAGISAVTFIVRPQGDGTAPLADVRRIVQQTEPKMVVLRAGTVADAIDLRIAQDRLLARLSIAFGLVALLLAAIGLYGVLSYGVARRTNEIGIRKALGAQQSALIGMVLRETELAGVPGPRRRRCGVVRGPPTDRQPALWAAAERSSYLRGRDCRSRDRGRHRDVAARLPCLTGRRAGRAAAGMRRGATSLQVSPSRSAESVAITHRRRAVAGHDRDLVVRGGTCQARLRSTQTFVACSGPAA